MREAAALALVLSVAGAPAAAEEAWPSLSGSGIVNLPTATTLARGGLRLGLSLENRDRDPLRLDVQDLAVAWAYGLRARVELSGHAVVSRAVALPERHLLFGPPLDLVVLPGAALPARPYYPLVPDFPYVGRAGTSQVYRFVPGDAVTRVRVRLAEADAGRPALALGAEVKVPLTRALEKLQSGAGTGGVDGTLEAAAEWRAGRATLVVAAAYTRVGRPPFADRVLLVEPGGAVRAQDERLRLPDRLAFGAGIRRPLGSRLALVAEARKVAYAGTRTMALAAAGPVDLTAAAQVRWGRARITLGVRWHANSVPPRREVPHPLGGAADLSRVSAEDLAAYLRAAGAEAAIGRTRSGGSVGVAFGPGAPPLPQGTRLLPQTYAVRSHGQVGTVVAVHWERRRR